MRRTLQRLLFWAGILLGGCAPPETPNEPAGTAPLPYVPPRGNGGALVYSGTGSWPYESRALLDILHQHGVPAWQVVESQLSEMSLDQLASFSLLVMGGGDSNTIVGALTPDTRAKLREAVQERGLNYLGFCAGAWIAVGPSPPAGEDLRFGLGLFDSVFLDFTSMHRDGKEFAMIKAIFGDRSFRDLLWWGGPVTFDQPGAVVARYADGSPAISQTMSGSGFVLISGLHPAVGADMIRGLGLQDSDGENLDYAWTLLDAAMHQTRLPAF